MDLIPHSKLAELKKALLSKREACFSYLPSWFSDYVYIVGTQGTARKMEAKERMLSSKVGQASSKGLLNTFQTLRNHSSRQ